MRYMVLAMAAIYALPALADNIVINGKRFIYPQAEKEITVKLNNTSSRPALAQVWLDNGDPNVSPENITTPFVITPPISRMDAQGGQSIRIRLGSASGLPADKESLWWLNVLDIPAAAKKGQADSGGELQMAIRSRLKFIYRPQGLSGREQAADKLVLKGTGNTITVSNPTPFYITVIAFLPEKQKALNSEAVMLAPQSTKQVTFRTSVRSGDELSVVEINDFGGTSKFKKKII